MTSLNDDIITNADRAERLHAALENYNDEYGAEANLVHMLADERHWCDRNSQNFAELDRMAYQHYVAEFSEERRGRV